MPTVVRSYQATVGTEAVEFTVPADRLVSVYHSGFNASLDPVATPIYVDSTGETATASTADGEGKHTIFPATAHPIAPNKTSISIIAAADTLIEIVCSDIEFKGGFR